MVKHIVMFKLKENSPENMDLVLSTLRGLEGKIETLRMIEVGLDCNKSERAYDIVLTTHFDDEAGLAAYVAHPKHLPVIDTMRALCSSSIVVDYLTE
ncbi:MAG: Dabb family protein [Deltaproteobacteria bacterium]|jgi:hypothetical protein|nr:Dabb family protein [Deltaproteobacteria bacterium]